MSDTKYFLDDSLVHLMLKKKHQSLKRFYRSGTLDTENIVAALSSKNVFTRISGDNQRGSCHIWMDMSGSTHHTINGNLTRMHLISACGYQMGKYLDRFFKVKLGLFKDDTIPLFDVPKKLTAEQFAEFIFRHTYRTHREDLKLTASRLFMFLGMENYNEDRHSLFFCEGGNDAPQALRNSVDKLEKSNKTSLIIAICDGDPYATCNRNNIEKLREFQKKHAVIFSVIDDERTRDGNERMMKQFENEYGIKTVFTSDQDAIKTGGGMVINNTLIAAHKILTQRK